MKNGKCLYVKCTREAVTRGLCANCYAIALKIVKADRTTFEKLEKAKKILPKKKFCDNEKTDWFLEK